MDKASPLGLTEVEENSFRVLLTKIREHDQNFLYNLMVECTVMTQPPETIKAYHQFDSDDILERLVVVAKGVKVASSLNRLLAAGEEL